MAVELHADDGNCMPMGRVPGAEGRKEPGCPTTFRQAALRASGTREKPREHRIGPAEQFWMPPVRQGERSGADLVKAWPERGMSGTQPGPDRTGQTC